MLHENEIAIKILTDEFGDYPRNSWHYDREYRMICEALRLSKLSQVAVSICACGSKEYYVEQYKDVTKYYCKSCHEKISKH